MQQSKIKDLRSKILKVLEEFPETRNDDVLLTLHLWCKLHKDKIFLDKDFRKCIRLVDIPMCVREDNVKRLRAKIQNEEHRFLPTTEACRRQRKINQQEWALYCNNNR